MFFDRISFSSCCSTMTVIITYCHMLCFTTLLIILKAPTIHYISVCFILGWCSHIYVYRDRLGISFFYYKTSIWILLSSLRCTLASLGVASFDSLKYLLLPCTFWLIKHIFYPIVYIQNVFWHCCGFFSVEGKQPST